MTSKAFLRNSQLLSPKLDVVFKTLFTSSPQSLKVFISDMLGIPEASIQKIEFANTEITPALPSEKLSRLDLCLYVDDKAIDIEIQVKNNRDFEQRALFYWARLYSSALNKGEKYRSLRPTITLNLLDYIQFEDREVAHAKVVPMFADTHKTFSTYQEMHFYELPKMTFPLVNGKTLDKMTRQELWLLFLNIRDDKDLTMLYKTNDEAICNFIDDYRFLCESAELKAKAINREIEILDHNSAIFYAKEEGIKEGIKEGIIEGREAERERMVKNMRACGMSEDEIQKILQYNP